MTQGDSQINSLSHCLCFCLCQCRGTSVLPQIWFYGTGVEFDVQGTNSGPAPWHRPPLHRSLTNRVERRGEEQGGEKVTHPAFLLSLGQQIHQLYPAVSEQCQNKESCVKFSLFAGSSNTVETSESGSHGNSMTQWRPSSRCSSPRQCSSLSTCLNTDEINELWWVEIAYGWALIQRQEYRLCCVWVLEHSLFGTVG